ncbi:hypothetical protein J5N97_024962 [Dioscorea zingiberensis]|uniref:4-coumarate--CoA ligase n=1 Tax=Dioscorea zingiberensis TaxID=325984 RepID=A0A9D5C7Y0_9LILI|nr:hypothetical protein J5N97_024962 [Dioscorea zingiberensis]
MAETLTQKSTPSWYSTNTGIYSALNTPRTLPTNPTMDLVTFLFSHSHGGETALVDASSGLSISYQELQELVMSMASGLQSIGVSKGHLVLLLLPNTLLLPVILLGALSVGAVVTAMNPLSSREEIKKNVGHGNSVLAFAFLENMKKIDGFGFQVIAVPDNHAGGFVSSDFNASFKLLYCDPRASLRPEIRQTDTAAILYSSGTSGASKGVVLTHANLIAMVELFVRFEASQYDREPCENVYLAAIPMFHVYGMSLLAIGLLSLGSKVVVMNKFGVEEAVNVIDTFKVTHFPVVPPILTALTQAKAAGGCELKSLIQVSSGAAPLSRKIIHEFLDAFPHVDLIQVIAEDEEAGEIPVAFIVRAPGSAISSSEIIEYTAKRVTPYKKVRKVVFVQSIPRTPAGKILKRVLKNHNGGSKL